MENFFAHETALVDEGCSIGNGTRIWHFSHIMSNSTFSWWGTFLNKNLNKKIVAPSTWFGPGGPNAKDIYEPYWNLVSVQYKDGNLILK